MRINNGSLLLIIFSGLLSIQKASGDDARRTKSSPGCRVTVTDLAKASKTASAEPEKSVIYVPDTNALYNTPSLVEPNTAKDLVIPLAVIEELDRHKREFNTRGTTSREITRDLDQLIELAGDADIISTSGGGSIQFGTVKKGFEWPVELDETKADHKIIAVAKQVQDANPNKRVIILTDDLNMKIVAKGLGVKASSAKVSVNPATVKKILEGPIRIAVNFDQLQSLQGKGSITLEEVQALGFPKDHTPYNNQFVVFERNDAQESKGPFKTEDAVQMVWRFHRLDDGREVFTPLNKKTFKNLLLLPRNLEQLMAFDLLLDSRIHLVTIAGQAGTGKTLLTLAAAMAQSGLFYEKPPFERVILTRPHRVVGQDIGFLPGTEREKVSAYMGPFRDNFEVLLEAMREHPVSGMFGLSNGVNGNGHGNNGKGKERRGELAPGLAWSDLLDSGEPRRRIVEKIMNSDFVDTPSMAYIRGRSFPRTLIVVDEAQNLTELEVKTIVSRAGEGAKVVLLGDTSQIDHEKLNETNNGLIIAADRFRDQDNAAHITLIQGERSRLATQAGELLGRR